MAVATITSKGQITIPVQVRKKLRLKPGDRVDFILEEGGAVRLKAHKRPLTDLLGVLKGAGRRPLSVEETKQAVLDVAEDDWRRVRYQKRR
jgi:AbrB family looped-hinge helix DNA binding protein